MEENNKKFDIQVMSSTGAENPETMHARLVDVPGENEPTNAPFVSDCQAETSSEAFVNNYTYNNSNNKINEISTNNMKTSQNLEDEVVEIENNEINEPVACANQEIANNEVAEEAPTSVEPALASLDMKTVQMFSFLDAVNKGYRFCTLDANRPIRRLHVTELEKAVAVTKRFTVPGVVTWAADAVRKGYKVFDFETGVEVQPDSPELASYFLVCDAQHRLTVALSKLGGIDLDFYLVPCPADLVAYIKNYNTAQASWSTDDFRRSNSVASGKPDEVAEATGKLLADFPGLRAKTAQYALLGGQMTKAKAIQGFIPTVLPDKTNTARHIFLALNILANLADKKSLSYDAWRQVNGMWEAYYSSEKNGKQFSHELLVCLATASKNDVTNLRRILISKNFGKFGEELRGLYEGFLKSGKDIETMYHDALAKAEAYAEEMRADGVKKAELMHEGSSKEILEFLRNKQKTNKKSGHEIKS